MPKVKCRMEIIERCCGTVGKTVRCLSVRLSHLPAAVACGGFAAAIIDAIQHGIDLILSSYTKATLLIHTIQMSIQNVLKTCMRAKRKLHWQFGTSRELFPSYLHEFMYRNTLLMSRTGHVPSVLADCCRKLGTLNMNLICELFNNIHLQWKITSNLLLFIVLVSGSAVRCKLQAK